MLCYGFRKNDLAIKSCSVVRQEVCGALSVTLSPKNSNSRRFAGDDPSCARRRESGLLDECVPHPSYGHSDSMFFVARP